MTRARIVIVPNALPCFPSKVVIYYFSVYMGACVIYFSLAASCFGWGDESHKLIAYIAGNRLDDQEVVLLQRFMEWDEDPDLVSDQIADEANWADEQGINWGFHTGIFEDDALTGDIKLVCGSARSPGCFWSGMKQWTEMVLDPTIPMDERQDAMRYIFHIIGDAFQPLHVGREADWGGSKIHGVWEKYTYLQYGKFYTLHQVWDKALFYFSELQRITAVTPTRSEQSIKAQWLSYPKQVGWEQAAKSLMRWMTKPDGSQYAQCLYRPANGLDIQDPIAVRTLFRRFAKSTARIARDSAYLDHNNAPVVSRRILHIVYMQTRSLIMKQQLARAAAELACFLKDILAALPAVTSTTTSTKKPKATSTTTTVASTKKPKATSTATTVASTKKPKATSTTTTVASTEKLKKPKKTTTTSPYSDDELEGEFQQLHVDDKE